MFSYDNLMNYFKTNFALMQHHKYNLGEIEEMVPWEKFVYLDLLKEHIKIIEERRRDQASVARRR